VFCSLSESDNGHYQFIREAILIPKVMRAVVPEFHPPVRIGISSCVLGEEVRFDGGHKRDRFLTDLSPHPTELMLRNHV
jgi:hypothetical protein